MAELPLQSITIGSNKYILSGSGGGSVDSTSEPTEDTVAEFDSDAHMNSTDMTTGSGSELEDFIDGLNVSGGLLGDYVIEQGASGIWTYRKWNSGIAECWGTYTGTVSYATATSASGGYRATISSIPFPFTFTASPRATATHNGDSTYYYGTVSNISTWDSGCALTLDRGNSVSNVQVSVTISVQGRWK